MEQRASSTPEEECMLQDRYDVVIVGSGSGRSGRGTRQSADGA